MSDTADSSPTVGELLRSPVQLLAFGLGSGLFPRAPGTAGTLVAVPFFWLLSGFSLPVYTALVVLAAVVGVWLCGAASRNLQAHDHPGIVWDEFVGFWITMWALPVEPLWIAAGFVVFRLYDIAKPWPIGAVDRKIGGGLGIMLDDMVAGVMACATLHLVHWLMPTIAGTLG